MFKNLDDYIIYKYLYYIIFNPMYELKFNNDIEFLKLLKIYLTELTSLEILVPSVKYNILTELSDLRFIEDEYRLERLEIINEIIILLNSSEYDENFTFYREQLYNREGNRKFLKKYKNYIIYRNIDMINEMIMLDYCILISHIEVTSDERFLEDYLSEFIYGASYYKNLDIIINEYPDIINNKTFVERVNKIHYLKQINNQVDEKSLYITNKVLVKK